MKGQGGAVTRAPNHSGGAEILRGRRMIAGTQKNPNNVTRTFFNTAHLLPESSGSKMGVRNLFLAPGAI